MILQDLLTSELFTYAAYLPGIGAALLALYNWYQMQRGAVINLNQPVNYGLIRDEEIDGAIKFYFPILTYNEGSKAGMAKDLTISFKSGGVEKKIDISRRVEMVHEEGTEEEDTSIIGAEPMFPFFVPSDEGNVTIFECIDYDHEVIPLNERVTCKIYISYDHKKKTAIEFPFQLYSDEISLLLRGTMKWLKPTIQEVSPSTLTDRDHLRAMLQEMNMEDEYEVILDRERTHFDRTVKYNGSKIVRLDLSELKLATLPESIQNFEYLEFLHLGHNLLTTLPESIGNLKHLKELNVRNNKGIASIPDSIGQLSNLQFLSLYGGNLSTIPDSIGSLKSLTWLRLSENQIKFLPESLGNLLVLERLDLENNELESLPETIGSLQKLKTLNIQKNKLKSVPPSILKIKQFTQLEFNDNQISAFPPNLIQDGGHITGLFFHENNIETLPDGLERLERLATLNIKNNPLTSLTESVEASIQILKNRGCNIFID